MYIALFLASVLVSSISQVMLKKSANKPQAGLRQYLNPLVLTAYAMFFGASLLTVIAYRGVALSLGPVLESAGYVYVAVLSYLFLQEKLTLRKLIGMALVLLGILLFSLGG